MLGRFTVGAALTLLAMVGCAPVAPDETADEPTSPSVYEELLAVIPDTPETREGLIRIVDLARIREDFSVTFPSSGMNIEPFTQELAAIFSIPGLHLPEMPFISSASGNFQPEIFQRRLRDLAFDYVDMHQTVLVGDQPRGLEIVRGNFNPQVTTATMESCAECLPPTLVEHRGVTYYSWGEDFRTEATLQFAPPAFDRYGRGGRIAIIDDFAFRALYTEGVEGLIDARQGTVPSLADDEDFRLLVRGMSALDAYAFILTGRTVPGDPEVYLDIVNKDPADADLIADVTAELNAAPLLRPYTAFAAGATHTGEETDSLIVLVHATEEDATENVELLKARIESIQLAAIDLPWTDFVEWVDVRSEGRLLLAILGSDATAGYALIGEFLSADFLLAHETPTPQ